MKKRANFSNRVASIDFNKPLPIDKPVNYWDRLPPAAGLGSHMHRAEIAGAVALIRAALAESSSQSSAIMLRQPAEPQIEDAPHVGNLRAQLVDAERKYREVSTNPHAITEQEKWGTTIFALRAQIAKLTPKAEPEGKRYIDAGNMPRLG